MRLGASAVAVGQTTDSSAASRSASLLGASTRETFSWTNFARVPYAGEARGRLTRHRWVHEDSREAGAARGQRGGAKQLHGAD